MIKHLLFFTYIILTLGCTDLFSTRADEVEEPNPSASARTYLKASNPVNVLQNMAWAIEGKNTTEYAKLFSDSLFQSNKTYNFLPEASLSNQLLQPWGTNEEQLFFNKLISTEPIIRFTLLDSIPSEALSAVDFFDTGFLNYKISVKTNGKEVIYSGLSNFSLEKTNNAEESWTIYRWEDRAVDNNTELTWTALKRDYFKI